MPTTITTWHRRCVGDVPRLLLAVAARTVLWSVLLLALWSTLPAFLGWHVTTVVSGSMAPAIRTGDVVAAMPTGPDAVTPGRVLLVEDPDHDDRLRLHRLRRVEPDGSLRLRGDANPAADRTTVEPDAVLGIGVLRFPGVGLPRVWIADRTWSHLVAAGLGAAALLLLARLDRPILAGEPCRRCGTARWDLRTTPLRPGTPGHAPRSAAVPLVAGALVVLVGVTTAFSGASFSGTTTTAAALRSGSFPCFHAPAPSAVLAWDFAEKGGRELVDASGHGRDGVLADQSPRTNGSCSENPYVTFAATDGDGGAARTTTPESAPQTFALEVWFRTDVARGKVIGFAQTASGYPGAYDRQIYVGADGRLVFGVWETPQSVAVQTTTRVDDGRWHHAVGQFAPGKLELWLDGQRAAARSDVATAVQYNGHWRLGYGPLDSSWPNIPATSYFTGDVDTVRVHDQVLGAATIAAHAAAGR